MAALALGTLALFVRCRFELAGREGIEATMRKPRLLWVGAVIPLAAKHPHRRAMSGGLERLPSKEGGVERVTSRGREKRQTTCSNNDFSAFGSIGDRKEASNNADRWCEKRIVGQKRS